MTVKNTAKLTVRAKPPILALPWTPRGHRLNAKYDCSVVAPNAAVSPRDGGSSSEDETRRTLPVRAAETLPSAWRQPDMTQLLHALSSPANRP
eukprot:2233996-Pyramimonas_sp.AAC.3